ncbi:MAG: WD40 repeat domain-containing protein [Promethearchaeota archaeon]
MKKKKLKGHDTNVKCVRWSPDGEILGSGDEFGGLCLWNRDGDKLKKLNVSELDVKGIAWAPNGKFFAEVGGKIIKFLDRDGNIIKEFDGKSNQIEWLAWSPDGNLLATDSMECIVRLWDKDGNLVKELEGHTAYIGGIAWSPNGEMLATGSNDGSIKIWDKEGNIIKDLKEYYEAATDVAFSPDGGILAVGTWMARHIRLYDTITWDGSKLAAAHMDKISSVTWLSSGQMLASGSADKSVRFWKRDGSFVEKINVGKGVNAISISSDDKMLAVASWDKKLLLYDLAELKK